MSSNTVTISEVQTAIVTAIQELVIPRFDELETDITEVKQDVRILKDDIRVLKDDVRILKQDMREVKDGLSRLESRVVGMEADIKELYSMVAGLQKQQGTSQRYAKLTVEQRLLKMYTDFQALAKEAGVTLPKPQ